MTRRAKYLTATAMSLAAVTVAFGLSGAFTSSPETVVVEPPCDTCTARHKAKMRLHEKLSAPGAAQD